MIQNKIKKEKKKNVLLVINYSKKLVNRFPSGQQRYGEFIKIFKKNNNNFNKENQFKKVQEL